MKTYKIGNKISGIIRAYAPCKIGEYTLTYSNEPYTIFKGTDATLTFRDIASESTSGRLDSYYNNSKIYEVTISDVLITKKILNLIFNENEEKLCSVSENHTADDEGKIFLDTTEDTIYQVFIYNHAGELVTAYGTLQSSVIENLTAGENYLVVYSFIGDVAYNFNSNENLYLTLELKADGNENDETSTCYMRFEKCGMRINRQLIFNKNMNAVDLTFRIIDNPNSENYITFNS